MLDPVERSPTEAPSAVEAGSGPSGPGAVARRRRCRHSRSGPVNAGEGRPTGRPVAFRRLASAAPPAYGLSSSSGSAPSPLGLLASSSRVWTRSSRSSSDSLAARRPCRPRSSPCPRPSGAVTRAARRRRRPSPAPRSVGRASSIRSLRRRSDRATRSLASSARSAGVLVPSVQQRDQADGRRGHRPDAGDEDPAAQRAQVVARRRPGAVVRWIAGAAWAARLWSFRHRVARPPLGGTAPTPAGSRARRRG